MQRCFLVVNKETPIANYLQHRSIMEITEEHRSLTEINMEHLQIVDVDKFLYIYYPTDDGDLSFRSDMNAMRVLLSSAFFHVTEALFILVNSENPLLEDLIYSALRESSLTRDKIEIVQHTGTLMLSEVGKYVSGSAVGQTTVSSYKEVYIREADKEEQERYDNGTGSDIASVLPVLTDMAALYSQRANVEAISAGRVVSEPSDRPQIVSEFSRTSTKATRTTHAFIVSGERWTEGERAVSYLVNYYNIAGTRCLIINFNSDIYIGDYAGECTQLNVMDIKVPVTPELAISALDARFTQVGYVIEFLQNVRGVDNYIINVAPGDFSKAVRLAQQMFEVVYTVYVAHYNLKSVRDYLAAGLKTTALFLSFEHFKKDFNLQAFKQDLKSTVVAAFPTEDVDYIEFFNFATGGGTDEE